MYRLSSNHTLFWKIFLPVFYVTFFGMLVMASYLSDEGDLPLLTAPISKLILTSCYVLFVGLMWFTIVDLKRVEADDNYYYVTNYFKTYRYHKEDVIEIKSLDFGIFKWNTLVMKETTRFGRRISFIGNPQENKK